MIEFDDNFFDQNDDFEYRKQVIIEASIIMGNCSCTANYICRNCLAEY